MERSIGCSYRHCIFVVLVSALPPSQVRDKYKGFPSRGGRFYDIGAGTGKPVIAAALLHPWELCCGVELLGSLHAASLELLGVWTRSHSDKLLPPWVAAKIEFAHADATTFAWDDADVWFANSTCFDDALLAKLAIIADRMRIGTHAITFTKRVPSQKWQVCTHATQLFL